MKTFIVRDMIKLVPDKFCMKYLAYLSNITKDKSYVGHGIINNLYHN